MFNMKTDTPVDRRINWFSVITLAALVTLMPGCAGVPEAPPEIKQQALSFTPPPGMAGLYLIRPYHFAGAAVLWKAQLDYQEFGSLKTSSYLYSAVLPGKHLLRTGAHGDAGATTFIAEAGKNYYFSMRATLKLDPVPESQAQEYVRQFKLSGDNLYKAPFSP